MTSLPPGCRLIDEGALVDASPLAKKYSLPAIALTRHLWESLEALPVPPPSFLPALLSALQDLGQREGFLPPRPLRLQLPGAGEVLLILLPAPHPSEPVAITLVHPDDSILSLATGYA